jgi:hypothetical protein
MFTENLSVFFADFGVNAKIDGKDVRVIFDNAAQVGSLGAYGMAATQPTALVESRFVPADYDLQGITVNGQPWTIVAAEPDGTGLTRLYLGSIA